tara:strand:+ start:759 stop:1634 length:876 start_codon:yes stop_codon:yes gene_type:complete
MTKAIMKYLTLSLLALVMVGCSDESSSAANHGVVEIKRLERPHSLTMEEIDELLYPKENLSSPELFSLKGIECTLGRSKSDRFELILMADKRLNLWGGPSEANKVHAFAGHGGFLDLVIDSIEDSKGNPMEDPHKFSKASVGFYKDGEHLRGVRICSLSRDVNPGEKLLVKGNLVLSLPINWETHTISSLQETENISSSEYLSSEGNQSDHQNYWMIDINAEYRKEITVVEHIYDKKGELVEVDTYQEGGRSYLLKLPDGLEQIGESQIFISGAKERREIPIEFEVTPIPL